MEGTLQIKELIKRRFSNEPSQHPALMRVTTGFKSLDWVLDGLSAGLIVMGARPCIGNTTLALNMAVRQSVRAKLPVAFYSLDLVPKQLTDRALCILSGLPIENMRWSQRSDYERLQEAINQLEDAPLFCNCNKGIDLSHLTTDIKLLVENEKVRVVYIDNLETLSTNEGGSPKENKQNVYLTLKSLAHELGISIVVLCYTNSDIVYREGLEGKTPVLSDVNSNYNGADTDEIADIVILPSRPEYYHLYENERGDDLRDIIIVYVAKNKYGPSGYACLQIDHQSLSLSIVAYRGRAERIGGPNEKSLAPSLVYFDDDNADRIYRGASLEELRGRFEKMKKDNPCLSRLETGLGLEIDEV